MSTPEERAALEMVVQRVSEIEGRPLTINERGELLDSSGRVCGRVRVRRAETETPTLRASTDLLLSWLREA